MEPVHIPILRAGEEYTSLELVDVTDPATGEVLARVSQANAGMIRRDLRKLPARTEAFRQLSVAKLVDIFAAAEKAFLEDRLPVNQDGATQSPDDYVALLSRTSGLPHSLCWRNMTKIATVFSDMGGILRGLMRGMDFSVVDEGYGEQQGVPVCYGPVASALGVVLPSNSPGVNSIWMPSIALKVPVVLKPGREEPWTPVRIVQALIAAGCPRAAFSLYPTDHEGSATILEHADRTILFGDEAVTKQYAGDPSVEIHGPGRSKVLIGEDVIESWRDHLDVLVDSVAANGGRSCINASTILVPSHGDEIAQALAERMAEIEPRAPDDPDAGLSSFANPKMAAFVNASIDQGLAAGGARDVTASLRDERAVERDGRQYVLPTVIRCDDVEHPLARTEFLCPFVSVVEVPQDQLVAAMGPTLVVTAITKDPALVDAVVQSGADRVNLGPVPTSHVEWDQPHEGNLFEFLYSRRAIQRVREW